MLIIGFFVAHCCHSIDKSLFFSGVFPLCKTYVIHHEFYWTFVVKTKINGVIQTMDKSVDFC